jgi:formylglycine-generating enzyme required for sulfatase activity
MKFVPVPGTNVFFGIWDTRVKDYRAFAEANAGTNEHWKNPGFPQKDDEPVVGVTWDEAKAFCAWLTQKERKEGRIGKDQEYRLPTAQEWLAAAGPAKYAWGDQWPPPKDAGDLPALHIGGFMWTSPVGSFKANQYGLFDMAGNVWQWSGDWLDSDRKARLCCGTSYGDYVPGMMLTARRIGIPPSARIDSLGFRCVLASAPPLP